MPRTLRSPMPMPLPTLLLLVAACAWPGAVAAADFTGRGVFAFRSTSGCPLVAAAAAAETCNRIALDDAASAASLDVDGRVIRFADDRAYDRKTIVGDVLLQGTGVSAGGRRVPLNFHVVLSKEGREWSVNSHGHASVRGDFTDVRIDAYRIDAGDGGTSRTLVTPESIARTVARPALAARLARQFVQVRDDRRRREPESAIRVALGVGEAALPVLRASLQTPAKTDLDAALDRGTWALELQPLTGKIPDGVARRELFLFGMDTQPLLQPIVERGFVKGAALTVGAVDGKGYLRYAGREQPFADAASTTRRYLQQSFVGLALGWQQVSPVRDAR